MSPQLLLFDVNETLLDVKALSGGFAGIFGTSDPMGEWFARMLHGSLVANHTDRYRPFGLIGAEALMVLAAKRGVDLDSGEAVTLVESMRRLPAHPDVAPALASLAEAGFRMATLTNGSSDTVAEQLDSSGLARFFEKAISVDAVRRFKPAPETYLHAAVVLGADLDSTLMVAAHDWDIVGARSVGIHGAFVARPGVVWGIPDDPPELVGADLASIAAQLIAERIR
ncbi:MAG: haloacid dehalogenase type II [Acidimicrobiia bacterium]|nr:haloacid dehalogenase type II [Acidimicrobiia bacterium]